MAARWNPINKPSIFPRSPLSKLSSSVGNVRTESRKRKNQTVEDLRENNGCEDITSESYSSGPSRPCRAVKIVPSIETCNPLRAKAKGAKRTGGSPLPALDRVSGCSGEEAATFTVTESTTPPANKSPKTNHSQRKTARDCPVPSQLKGSQDADNLKGNQVPHPIYTPTHISIYPHLGTTKSSLPWTKNGDVLTPLECPSDLCPFIYSGETIAGVENKLGRAFDQIITELASSPSTVKQELDTKLGSKGAGMLVEIARKREIARWKVKTTNSVSIQPSESPLFITGTPRSRSSSSKSGTPKPPRFHARETPITPSLKTFQEERPREGGSPLKSKFRSPEKRSDTLSPFPDAAPISPPPSSPSTSINLRAPLRPHAQPLSKPQTPPPSSPPRPPPSSPNPKTDLKSEPESPPSSSANESTTTSTPSTTSSSSSASISSCSAPTRNTSVTHSTFTSASSTPTELSVDITDSESSTPTPSRPFTPPHSKSVLQARIKILEERCRELEQENTTRISKPNSKNTRKSKTKSASPLQHKRAKASQAHLDALLQLLLKTHTRSSRHRKSDSVSAKTKKSRKGKGNGDGNR